MNNLVDNMTETLKTLRKPVDVVMKFPPGPDRWRAAHDLLWKDLSSKNRQIYEEVVRENAITRESVDKFGRAVGLTKAERADKSIRNCLNIPVGAKTAIEKSDPMVFREPSNAPKFFKEFKEYSTREIY